MSIDNTAILQTEYKDFPFIFQELNSCELCPRKCRVNRNNDQTGFCGQTAQIRGARAALHYWEEPCISGTAGSGTVFFSGCNLKCVFCQNHEIAVGDKGKTLSVSDLANAFINLMEKGANNINLVTPTHFIPQIASAIELAKNNGLNIPVLYNCGGYESVDALGLLDGLIDIYMPDLKYYSPHLSSKYSNAPDYFEMASAAISEMYRQVGKPEFNENGLMKKGVLVRHLILPGQTADSKKILRYLKNTYDNNIYISIMNQYTPLPHVKDYPELCQQVSEKDYEKVLHFAEMIGIENGFIQEGDVALESFIPSFDYEGL